MDTIVAFLVTLGVASVSQTPTDSLKTAANRPAAPAVEHLSKQPEEVRIAQERFRKQIEMRQQINLTNAWLRTLRGARVEHSEDRS